MAEGNLDDAAELQKVDPEVDYMREISHVLVEKTIENNTVDPGGEDCGMMVNNPHLAAEPTEGTGDTNEYHESNCVSTMLTEEMGNIEQGSGKIRTCPSRVEETIGETEPRKEASRSASHPRSSSMAITSHQLNKLKVPSRYLSGPYISCHDYCKYGGKLTFEEKEKDPLLRTISGLRALGKSTSSVERKATVVRRLSFPAAKVERPSTLLVKPKARHIASRSNPSSPRTPSSLGRRQFAEAKTRKKMVVLERLSHKTCKSSESFSKDDRKSMGQESASVSAKLPINKSASIKPRHARNLDEWPRIEKFISVKESEVHPPDDVPEKTLYMIEPNDDNKAKGIAKPAMHARSSQHSPQGKQASKAKISKGRQTTNQKCLLSLTSSSMPTKSWIYKMKTLSKPRDGEQGELRHFNAEKNHSIQHREAKATQLKVKPDTEPKEKVKRVLVSQSAGEDTPIRKLKFRRGTVLALPGADTSPKKIIFKRGRMLAESQYNDAKVGNRSFKEREYKDKELNQAKVEPEKVALRHQETSGRVDSLNLNNIIEETASELVKTRKSKVKALVGAFESVMSLKKPNTFAESGSS